MLCLETRLVFRLLEGVIYRLEALVVGDVLDKRLDFPQPRFNAFQLLAGTVIRAVNVLDLLLKIGVLEQVVFREKVECPRRFLEYRELGFMLIALAVDEPDPLLNISDERDTLRRGLLPASSRRPSGYPLLDAFLGVVLSNSFRSGKSLLTFSSEGDVFAGLDFITGFLHEPQKVIVVLRYDDKPVDGLLELLLPACAVFGFGVFLVVHALVLRRRDHRQPVFLAYLIAELTQLLIGSLVAPVGMKVYIVYGIEDDVIVTMPLVDVGCNHILVFALEPFVRELFSDFMRFFWCHLTDVKRLNQMTGKHLRHLHSLLHCKGSCPFKFFCCRVACSAPIGRNIEGIVGLLRVKNIGESFVYSSSDWLDFSNCHISPCLSFSSAISSA